MTNTPAYQRAYNNARRADHYRRGLCVRCDRKRRRGRTPSGKPYSRCQRCIDRQARYTTISRYKRNRRGLCLTCPRRVTGKHWQCSRCLGVRHGRPPARRRLAA